MYLGWFAFADNVGSGSHFVFEVFLSFRARFCFSCKVFSFHSSFFFSVVLFLFMQAFSFSSTFFFSYELFLFVRAFSLRASFFFSCEVFLCVRGTLRLRERKELLSWRNSGLGVFSILFWDWLVVGQVCSLAFGLLWFPFGSLIILCKSSQPSPPPPRKKTNLGITG